MSLLLQTENTSANYTVIKNQSYCGEVVKDKSNPCTGPEGSRRLRHTKLVWLSALCTDRLYPPGNIPGTHFC
jgi:hypothetical protein